MEAKTLEDLSCLECRTCLGERQVHAPNLFRDDDDDWSDCLDCQDSEGQPTGLLLPELTERCWACEGRGIYKVQHEYICPHCLGRGRLPKSGDSLLVAVRKALGRHAWYQYTWLRAEGWHVYTDSVHVSKAKDELAAATEALRAVMEGEHGC